MRTALSRPTPPVPSPRRGGLRKRLAASEGRLPQVCIRDEHGKPTECPEPLVASGWVLAEFTGRWHYVDACQRHASQLLDRPRRR